MDTFHLVRVENLLAPTDFLTTMESSLVDVSNHNGRATVVFMAGEDANEAATELLVVTIHEVDSDSDVLAAANLVDTMETITGQADVSPDPVVRRTTIDLNSLTKPYIQLLITETNTWEGEVAAFIVLSGKQHTPENSVTSTDDNYKDEGGIA